jgi:flagellar basal body-associated protein FliL
MQKQSQAEQNRERKRAEFSAPSQSKSKSTIILIIVAVVAVAGVIAYVLTSTSSDNPASAPVAATSTPGVGQTSDIKIPLAELNANAKFFDFKTADNNSSPLRVRMASIAPRSMLAIRAITQRRGITRKAMI